MERRWKDDELPPDDGSAEHDLLRLRRALRSRTDENARRILDASDRLHVVQLRATRAKLPEDQVLALTQALRHACEMYVLTMNDVAPQLERLVSAGAAASELDGAVDRLEQSVQNWGERLAKAEGVWLRSAEEVPQRLADSAAQAIRRAAWDAGRTVRWGVGVGILLTIVCCLSAYWSRQSHRDFESLLRPAEASATPPAGRERSRDR
jgi:hypothetical protein